MEGYQSMAWEIEILKAIQSIGNGVLDALFTIITMFGEDVLIVAILGFVYWSYNKEFGKFLGFSFFTSVSLNAFTKNIFLRERPFDASPDIINKRPSTATGYSFPSGHTQSCGTLLPSAAVWMKQKWTWICAAVIPVLVAISRLYLGAHYPTDVLVGLALGWGISLLSAFLFKKVKNKNILFIAAIVILSPGLFFAKKSDFFECYAMLIAFFVGNIFEERFVRFEMPQKWWQRLLRLVLGLACFLALRILFKWLFGLISPEGSKWLDGLRYLIMVFFSIGVLPLVFKPLHI